MGDDEKLLTTQECARRLNLAYGHKVISRRGILRAIRSGKLPACEVPAVGSRSRSLLRVPNSEFLDYCLVYHPDVRTAIRAICSTMN